MLQEITKTIHMGVERKGENMRSKLVRNFGKRALAMALSVLMVLSLFVYFDLGGTAHADGVNWVHLDGQDGRPNMPGHAVAFTRSGFNTLVSGAAHISIHTVHLGNDLSVSGTRVTANRNLTICGFNPMGPNPTHRHTITRAGAGLFNVTANRTITFQNLHMVNTQSRDGFIGAGGSGGPTWTTIFDNVDFGNRMIVNLHGSTVILRGNNYFRNATDELFQASHFYIEGENNVMRRTASGSHSMIWNHASQSRFVVRTGGSLIVHQEHDQTNRGFMWDIGGLRMTVEAGGVFEYYNTGANGVFMGEGNLFAGGRFTGLTVNGRFVAMAVNGGTAAARGHLIDVNTMYVGRGADVVIATGANAGARSPLHIRGTLQITQPYRYLVYTNSSAARAISAEGSANVDILANRVGTNLTATGLSHIGYGWEYTMQYQYTLNDLFLSSSIQLTENKYRLIIQFLSLVFMIHEVWLNE